MAALGPDTHGRAPSATRQSAILVGSECAGVGSEGVALKCADVPTMHGRAPDCTPRAWTAVLGLYRVWARLQCRLYNRSWRLVACVECMCGSDSVVVLLNEWLGGVDNWGVG